MTSIFPRGRSIAAPIASGDFTEIATNNAADGIYTVNGEAVAIGDIIDLDHIEANFDPVQDIDAGGIKSRDNGDGTFGTRQIPINNPLLTTLLTNGFTLLCEFDVEEDLTLSISCHDDMGNFDIGGTTLNGGPGTQRTIATDKDWNQPTDHDQFPIIGQVNKFAVTVAADHVSACINGGAVITTPSGGLDPSLASIVFGFGASANSRFRSFTFFEPVDSTSMQVLTV